MVGRSRYDDDEDDDRGRSGGRGRGRSRYVMMTTNTMIAGRS